jgi:WD40 repeat protein
VQASAPGPDQPAAKGTAKELVRIQGKGYITFDAIAPDGKTMAYGDAVPAAEGKPSRYELTLIDLVTGKELRRRQVDSARWGVFSPDGKFLAVGTPSSETAATVWDVARWEPKVQLKRPDGHTFGNALAFSPDGKFVAGSAVRNDGRGIWDDLVLWDLATGDCRLLEADGSAGAGAGIAASWRRAAE